MSKMWDVRNKRNREILGWFGGGLAAVIAGLWVAFVYFFPQKSNSGSGASGVEASCGSAAQQGTMVGSTITVGGTSSTTNCSPKK